MDPTNNRRALLALRVLAITLMIALAPRVIEGIQIRGYEAALVAAVLYVVVRFAIGWMVRTPLTLLAIVPALLSRGLFFWLVPIAASAILLKLTAAALESFDLTWLAALLLSLAMRALDLLLERALRGR